MEGATILLATMSDCDRKMESLFSDLMETTAYSSEKPSRSGWMLLTALLLGVAFLLRLLWLGEKPPHFDEGVNGWFIDQMTRHTVYRYDPANYHGPFHFYALFLSQTLFGRDIFFFRLPLVLVNLATLWVVLQYARFTGRAVALLAGVAFAVSSGMLFYTRYAIHEAWLVLGLVMTLWGMLDQMSARSRTGLWAIGLGVTLMVLTKETYLIHLLALLLAWGTLHLFERFTPSAPMLPPRAAEREWNRADLRRVVAIGGLLILVFYSGFFLDLGALRGLYETFTFWAATGQNDHTKEWPYWLHLMGRHEWPALLGCVYSVRALWPGCNRAVRLIAIYGCGTLVAYTLIRYKTPWCIISLLWPFFFLFGEAIVALAGRRQLWRKVTAAALAVVILCVSLGDAIRLNFLHPAESEKEYFFTPQADAFLQKLKLTAPNAEYIYVQTRNDLYDLTRPLEALRGKVPLVEDLSGHILLSSYHPLPWVLGDFTKVGFYEKDDHYPETMDAAFLLVDDHRVEEVEASLTQRYFKSPFQLRDGMASGWLYLEHDLFKEYFPGRTPEWEPQQP